MPEYDTFNVAILVKKSQSAVHHAVTLIPALRSECCSAPITLRWIEGVYHKLCLAFCCGNCDKVACYDDEMMRKAEEALREDRSLAQCKGGG